MLFNEPCKTGHLRVDARSVKVVSGKRILWTLARSKITYIAVKQGVFHNDLTIYTATSQFPAHTVSKHHTTQFLTFFPGVPHGDPPVVAQQQPVYVPPPYVPPPVASGAQWNAAPTAPFHVSPPVAQPPSTKKKPPRWAYIATGVLALVLCACISTAVIAAVTSNNGSQV